IAMLVILVILPVLGSDGGRQPRGEGDRCDPRSHSHGGPPSGVVLVPGVIESNPDATYPRWGYPPDLPKASDEEDAQSIYVNAGVKSLPVNRLPAFAALLLTIALATPAAAHDTWLLPNRLAVPPGTEVSLDLTSGM